MILMMVIMMMMMMMMVMINVSSTVMLQGALDLIVEWTSTWQLQLYVSKCNVNCIGHVPSDVEYSVYDTMLPHVTTSRDLGIVIAQDLSPSIHISEITAKAHQRANCPKT